MKTPGPSHRRAEPAVRRLSGQLPRGGVQAPLLFSHSGLDVDCSANNLLGLNLMRTSSAKPRDPDTLSKQPDGVPGHAGSLQIIQASAQVQGLGLETP